VKPGAINFFSHRALIARKQLALSRHVASSHTHLGSFDTGAAASFSSLSRQLFYLPQHSCSYINSFIRQTERERARAKKERLLTHFSSAASDQVHIRAHQKHILAAQPERLSNFQ
jgi:hypothetical protein